MGGVQMSKGEYDVWLYTLTGSTKAVHQNCASGFDFVGGLNVQKIEIPIRGVGYAEAVQQAKAIAVAQSRKK